MIKFPGFPRPTYDETFTSWIFRCGNCREINLSSLADITVSEDCVGGRIVYEDPDFDFESPYFLAASRLMNLDKNLLKLSFSPRAEWILPWWQRRYYCPDCLADDVRERRAPSWRRAWCYAFVSHCEIHKKQLIELDGPVSQSKAWDAFVSSANSNYTCQPNRCSKWASRNATAIRYLLQRKALRVFKTSSRFPIKKRRRSDIFFCFKVIAQILLMPSTLFNRPGAARCLFSDGRMRIDRTLKSYPDIIEIGSLESTSHERMCAVILAGFILSIYGSRELDLIRRVYRYAGINFPDDKFFLGFWAFNFSSVSDYNYVKSMFSFFPKKVILKAKKYIDGIEAASAGIRA